MLKFKKKKKEEEEEEDAGQLFKGLKEQGQNTLVLVCKVAHVHGGQGKTEERSRPLQIGSWQFY